MAVKPSRYIAPIDGLRAIAVTAVILYHLGINWIPGGFLGVDLFFVISGYVITRLLLDSIMSKGALDLREFYWARMRRLVPALLFMLAGTTFVIAAWKPDAIHRFLSDLPYVLTGSENWHLVGVHQDYFQAIGRPPLLQHIWSLGVEIQFYALWPLILLAILRYFGKKRVAQISLAIAFISGLALFIYSIQVDSTQTNNISHIYFGTDTHSLGLFLGAALAVSWIPKNLNKNISQRAQDFVDGIGVFGLLGLLCTFFFIDESNPALYRLAFPLAALFGCAIITSLVHPASRFAPLLSARPIVWIGQRSYGIYLWHWVIFQVTRPNVDLAGASWAINCARILIVIALADISLRWVEIPIRRGTLANWFRGMKYRTKVTQRNQKIWVALVLVGFVASTGGAAWAALNQDKPNAAPSTTSLLPTLSSQSVTPTTKPGLWVTGDSIILGIRDKLQSHFPIELINARVGRQIGELIQVVTTDRPGLEQSKVIFDIGNNNHLTESDVRTLFELLKNQPQMIVVDSAVPRVWRDDNNRIIRLVLADYPQARMIDWATISQGHPEYFAPDGVHLSDAGGDVYVSAILEALK
ncbi:MAG: acyltransferase family protein [Actinomycetes bacterium]